MGFYRKGLSVFLMIVVTGLRILLENYHKKQEYGIELSVSFVMTSSISALPLGVFKTCQLCCARVMIIKNVMYKKS